MQTELLHRMYSEISICKALKSVFLMEAEKYFKLCFPCKYTMDAQNSDLGSIYKYNHERKFDNCTMNKGGCFKVFSCTKDGMSNNSYL